MFGGIGLMIERPGLQLAVEPAHAWSAEGPLAERALAFARMFVASSPEIQSASSTFRVTIESAPPEHVGLGLGTQLGLAVAKSLAVLHDLSLDAAELARRVGRGARSALGIHGFAHGGFLVDGGKGPQTDIAPLIARLPFPDDWRIVLIIPKNMRGLHGTAERRAFDENLQDTEKDTEAVCRLVLLGLLPALAERDLPTFAEALYEFNRRVGEMFRPIQGGIYAQPRTQELVDLIRGFGISGVGQSSWGPTVFAIASSGEADRLAEYLRSRCDEDVLVTAAAHQGAVLRRAYW